MEWITLALANWDTILFAATTIVTGASIITKITPTKVDDKWAARVLKVFEFLALNNKPVEQRKPDK